jgi:hypothetical protein
VIPTLAPAVLRKTMQQGLAGPAASPPAPPDPYASRPLLRPRPPLPEEVESVVCPSRSRTASCSQTISGPKRGAGRLVQARLR